jgi:hypothetical protein
MRVPVMICAIAIVSTLPPRSEAQSGPGDNAAASQPNKDRFLTGPAFTFADLAKAVGAVYEDRLKAAVEKRGIAATLTEAQMAQLRAAGASAELLELIRIRMPAPPPITGALTLQCLPAECDITVNGRLAGTTRNGQLEVKGLRPGETAVAFLRSGYVTERQTLTVDANTSRLKQVRLRPDAETQKIAGKELFDRMRKRLGAVQSLPALGLSGTAVLWDNGQRNDWEVFASVDVQGQTVSLDLQRGGLTWRTTLTGTQIKSEGSGKLKGSALPAQLEQLARVFYANQLSALIASLSAAEASQITSDLSMDAQGNRVLQAQSGPDTYAILIAPDGTPLRLHHAGLEVAYDDFAVIQNCLYPKTFAVRNLSNAGPATVLRFARAGVQPKLLKGAPAADAKRRQTSLIWMWKPA